MDDLHSVVSKEQVEIERTFAGAVLVAPDLARKEAGWLAPETLMNPEIKEFWERVRSGEDPHSAGMSISVEFYSDLTRWMDLGLTSLAVGEYAAALQEKNYLRETIVSAEALVKASLDGRPTLVEQIVNSMMSKRFTNKTGMRNPKEIADSLNERIDQGNITIPWGVDSMDAATMGAERGTMTVLAGRPSMGKSSLAFQCNEHQALEQRLRVGVWAVEMSAEQMFARRNCYKVGATWQEVRSGLISPADKASLKKYNHEYAEALKGHMWINDSTETTTMDIVRTQLREGFDVLMIDHLGLLKDPRIKGERHDQYLGRLTETLHSLAKNTNSVVILLAQLNRGVEQRTDKRPTMSDLRDSGQIEQNADNVALIYGEWYYNVDADNVTEVNFGKFRDGVIHSRAYVRFDKTKQHFDSLEQREIDAISTAEMQAAKEGNPLDGLQEEIPF